MMCFSLPLYFCKRLNSVVRNFWWGGAEDKNKISWKRWEVLTRPKFEGGLGFRDFKCFNRALLAKQGWRLLTNPDAYWANFLKAIYFPIVVF